MKKNDILYAHHDYTMFNDPRDALEDFITKCGGMDSIINPIKIVEYRRVQFTESDVKALADRVLEYVIDRLDEDHADPDSYDRTEETEKMQQAALTFAKVITDEYIPWECEPTGKVIEWSEEEVEKFMEAIWRME